MKGVRCSVCADGLGLIRYVDASPDLSAATLSRQAEAVGMDVSAARILTHRKHRREEEPARLAKTKRDFAVMVRDRIMDAVVELEPEVREDGSVGVDPILMKELQPAISTGLKAEAQIENRERAKAGKGNAELAFAIISMLRGDAPLPAQIEDGLTIDGEAVDLSTD